MLRCLLASIKMNRQARHHGHCRPRIKQHRFELPLRVENGDAPGESKIAVKPGLQGLHRHRHPTARNRPDQRPDWV